MTTDWPLGALAESLPGHGADDLSCLASASFDHGIPIEETAERFALDERAVRGVREHAAMSAED
jgi:hypothetical protein